MSKVSVVLVLYNSKKFIKLVFDAVLGQTHKDLEVIAVINADDGAKEILQQDYPQVTILDPGENLGFAGGNNLGIRNSSGEFIQLVNPDLILEPDYIEKILKAFNDPKVAAATGKLLRYDFEKNQKTNIIDSTGITISASGRARDRGQLEEDQGQYDYNLQPTTYNLIFGVSGAGPMYRRAALEKVKYCHPSSVTDVTSSPARGEDDLCEFFDEDFGSYWEDVDLSWRLNNAGFKNAYVPEAVAYHGRTAGQAKGGYLHLWHFIKHHQRISPRIRQLNYKNHILMYIKNAKYILHPAFILRELAMLMYVIIFETSTLKVIPELCRQVPKILKKRKWIYQ
ncbi:MAG: glycosyltransferase family 2 protein [Candidatus Doudnabacteria bacterium]|nr:glycosyltransferase family 2 protein [Candidatus Doudnabacteria bacterium]